MMNSFLTDLSYLHIIAAVSLTGHQNIFTSNTLMSMAEEVVKYTKCLPAYQKNVFKKISHRFALAKT